MILRKIGLLLGVSLLITVMMPQRAAMNFNFAPGETWEEETLVAPFDVPVYKEAEQLNAERKALMEEFQPVFRLDPAVGEAQLRTLRADLAANSSLSARADLARFSAGLWPRGGERGRPGGPYRPDGADR